MNPPDPAPTIDFGKILDAITAQFACGERSIHGPAHWRRVEAHAIRIAGQNGAVLDVVRLFALFHDSRRRHDGYDRTHGAAGADFATHCRGTLFELPDAHFELLHYACVWHTHGRLSDDPTIGACWDADRLDLTRIGITPAARFMSTEAGRTLAGPLHGAG